MSILYASVKLKELLKASREVARIISDQTYKQITVKLHHKGVTLRAEKKGLELKSKQYVAKQGQFVISKIDARNGAMGLVPQELDGAVVTGDFLLFDVVENRLFPKYLDYLVSTREFVNNCVMASEGTTNRVRLQPERFLEIGIPLPSLEEQKKTVTRIEGLVEKISEAKKIRDSATVEIETLVNAKILDIFAKGKESGWVEELLGNYVVADCYGTSEKATDDVSGTPILRMGNIQNGRLDVQDLKFLHLIERDRVRLLLKKGDMLVNRTNSAELVGKCAVFELDGEYAFASYLIRFRLDPTRAEPKLVAWYVNSPAGRAYMFNEKKQMTGQANVNATKLKALPISLPSLQEQRRIVAELDFLQKKVDEIEILQKKTEEEIEELIPGLLNRAFKGEL